MKPGQYLQSKNLPVLKTAPGEWLIRCPFCGDSKNQSHAHCYVNREHGAYMCHRCGESGSFYDLQRQFGDEPFPNAREEAEKAIVWRSATEHFQDDLLDSTKSLTYLREERGLEPATIGKYRLGYAGPSLERSKTTAFERLVDEYGIGDLDNAGLVGEEKRPLFWDRITIPYLDGPTVLTMRAKQIGGNVIQAKGTSIRLFGVDNIRDQDEVFICEGEFDAMLLDQLGYASCAIPGALSFQELWSMYLEGARRVFLLLDNDEAGIKGAERVKQFLGARAKIVRLPLPDGEESTDITEFFLRDGHTTVEFDALLEEHRSSRVFTLGKSLDERDAVLKMTGVSLGWKQLDAGLRPGLLPGQVVVTLAKTGVGKTAWLTQIIHNLAATPATMEHPSGPGIPVLMVSLEQTKAEIATRLERIGHLHSPWSKREDIEEWHKNFRMNDENRVPAEELALLIGEFEEEVGERPRVLIVDYLGYWARSFRASSTYDRVSAAIMEMKRVAKDQNLVVVTPHQVSRIAGRGERLEMDFARDSGVVEETADFAFGLFAPSHNKAQEQEDWGWRQRATVNLEILKSRHGNVGLTTPMLFAPYSLALVPFDPGSMMTRRVESEYESLALMDTYEDVLAGHQRSRYGT